MVLTFFKVFGPNGSGALLESKFRSFKRVAKLNVAGAIYVERGPGDVRGGLMTNGFHKWDPAKVPKGHRRSGAATATDQPDLGLLPFEEDYHGTVNAENFEHYFPTLM